MLLNNVRNKEVMDTGYLLNDFSSLITFRNCNKIIFKDLPRGFPKLSDFHPNRELLSILSRDSLQILRGVSLSAGTPP